MRILWDFYESKVVSVIIVMLIVIVDVLFFFKRANYCKLFSCRFINIDILRLVVNVKFICSL